MQHLSLLLLAVTALFVIIPQAQAETTRELRVRSEKALRHLYDTNHKAREIGDKAIAVLVFPTVYKAGFMV